MIADEGFNAQIRDAGWGRWSGIKYESVLFIGGLMKKGDIVKFMKAVYAGDKHLRMILLEDPDGGRALVKKLSIPFYTLEVSL
jgi:hypothetical protein